MVQFIVEHTDATVVTSTVIGGLILIGILIAAAVVLRIIFSPNRL